MRARLTLLVLLLTALAGAATAQPITTTANAAIGVVSTGYDAAATSIVLASGHGARFGSTFPMRAVWCRVDQYPGCVNSSGDIDPKIEYIEITARSTDTLTVTRAIEGPSASTKNDGGGTYWIYPVPVTAASWNAVLASLGANPQGLQTTSSPAFSVLTLSSLTAGRVPYLSTGGLFADSANMRFDATTPNAPFRFRLENETTPQAGITATAHTARIIMKANGASQIDGVRRALYVQADDDAPVNRTITGAANDGTNEVRITTSVSHGFADGDGVGVVGIVGTTEANGVWIVKDVTATTFDLTGPTFTNAYVSGGVATTRSSLVGIHVLLQPTLSRTNAGVGTNVLNDDLNGITIQASGVGKATDAFYLAGNPAISGAPAFVNAYATDADSNFFFRAIGKAYTAGIDLASATYDTGVPAIRLGPAANVQFDTATGTQVGTTSSQKIGVWGATPIVRPGSTSDIKDSLVNIGLITDGGATPINLDGGDITSQVVGASTTGIAFDMDGNFEFQVVGGILGISKYEASTSGAGLQFRKSRGTSGAPRRSLSGDAVSVITGQSGTAADNSTNSVLANVAQLQMIAVQDHTATETGTSIRLRSAPVNGTGLQDRYAAGNGKALTDNSAIDVVSMTLASNSSAGGIIRYTIEANDGTDFQIETGSVVIAAVNKGGAFTVSATEVDSLQSVSAGTLATTWAISSANPTVISVNANTSLSPAGGYPRITFTFENLSRQAVTYP